MGYSSWWNTHPYSFSCISGVKQEKHNNEDSKYETSTVNYIKYSDIYWALSLYKQLLIVFQRSFVDMIDFYCFILYAKKWYLYI